MKSKFFGLIFLEFTLFKSNIGYLLSSSYFYSELIIVSTFEENGKFMLWEFFFISSHFSAIEKKVFD